MEQVYECAENVLFKIITFKFDKGHTITTTTEKVKV